MIKINPNKLSIQKIQEGLTFNDYKKVIRPLFKTMKNKHAGADKPVDFFVITDYKFTDKTKKTVIFVPGKQDSKWKKFLNDFFKSNANNILFGQCYIAEEDKGSKLNLLPKKGKAKLKKIQTQGKMMFLNAKLSVQLAPGVTENQDSEGGYEVEETSKEAQDQQQEQLNKENNSNQENTIPLSENDSKNTSEVLKDQLKGLASHLGGVKTGFSLVKNIVSKYKSEKIEDNDEKELGGIMDNLKVFMDAFNNAHEKVQERMKDAHKKVSKQMPKIAALHQRLQKQKKKGNQTSLENSQDNSLTPEAIQDLKNQMEKAKIEIERLSKELDLDALLAQLN